MAPPSAGRCAHSARAIGESMARALHREEYATLKNRNCIQALGLLLTAMLATASMAGDGPSLAASTVAAQGHQLVFRDPLTGEVREPTAAEQAKLSSMIEQQRAIRPRSAATGAQDDASFRWRTVRLEDGTEAHLAPTPEQFHSSLVVERGADGKFHERHASPVVPVAQEPVP